MKVRDIMTSSVTSVRQNSKLQEAAQQMKTLNVGSLPVCDNSNKPVGIVTDRDIVVRGVSEGNYETTNVGNVMSEGLVSVSPDTDVHEAARVMAENQIRRLPIVENEKMVGIVSIGDLATEDIYTNEAGDALSSISEANNNITW